jgi:hypothetical protein
VGTHTPKKRLTKNVENPSRDDPGLFFVADSSRVEASEADAVAVERSELLARRHRGQRLSPGEQERLEVLTARLKELLPPVSATDLEALLEMAEEAERIRDCARERRQRVGLG